VAVTNPCVTTEGSTLGTNVGFVKLAKGNKVSPLATGTIPAVTIGFEPVMHRANVGIKGSTSGNPRVGTVCI